MEDHPNLEDVMVCYGLHGLTSRQQDLADHDAILWVKNARWMMRVKEERRDVEVLLEQLAEPSEWKEDAQHYLTFLNWDETMVMEKATGAKRNNLDQGAVGHMSRQPTTLITTIETSMFARFEE